MCLSLRKEFSISFHLNKTIDEINKLDIENFLAKDGILWINYGWIEQWDEILESEIKLHESIRPNTTHKNKMRISREFSYWRTHADTILKKLHANRSSAEKVLC